MDYKTAEMSFSTHCGNKCVNALNPGPLLNTTANPATYAVVPMAQGAGDPRSFPVILDRRTAMPNQAFAACLVEPLPSLGRTKSNEIFRAHGEPLRQHRALEIS